MNKLDECFRSQLADIYYAERQLATVLLSMAAAAKHAKLKTAFNSHRAQTGEQARRVERVFALLGEKIPDRKGKAMQSLISETQDCIDEESGDAALICAAQKIEHYEIATYGCLRSWAQFLDRDEAADLLEETLDEEVATNEHLTALAAQVINVETEESDKEKEVETRRTGPGKRPAGG